MAHISTSDHQFVQPGPLDQRAPCPALNALANHGYLPRNGRNVSFFQLVGALRTVYNLSLPFASILALGAVFVSLWTKGSLYVGLDDLATHNLIEHDASLGHADTAPGQHKAPTVVDRAMIDSLVRRVAPGHGITLADFACARVELEAVLSRPLGRVHAEIAQGEAALAWRALKDETGEVRVDRLLTWWRDERLDFEWWFGESKRDGSLGLLEVRKLVGKVARMMAQIRGKDSE